MTIEVQHSPPLHQPGDVTKRPKGILKNPSFSGPSGPGSHISPLRTSPEGTSSDAPLSAQNPFDLEHAKEITLQNTLQNAGRRSSSAARRASTISRRHSAYAGAVPGAADGTEEDVNAMRLKWDEANLYLAEQESGGRMKITEPKTPYQFGDAGGAMDEDDDDAEDDVAIDPRYVNVDEVDMNKKGMSPSRLKKHQYNRESDIPGLELGEPEEDPMTAAAELDADGQRLVRNSSGSVSREGSKEKHVSVSSGSGEGMHDVDGRPGMPTTEELEKHRQFEERRKLHYEMRSVKGMLGHFDEMDEDDDEDGRKGENEDEDDDEDEDEDMSPTTTSKPPALPAHGVNGAR